ncbi:MAG: AIPR family protein [Candidatus Omnitrophota bacterium]
MDRITRSYLNEFLSSNGLENEKNESTQFEHFVNFALLENKTEERFDIEELNIGKDDALGLDGFALILNRQVIETQDMLEDFLKSHRDVHAEVVFIQSKTSKSFETKEIGNFGWAVSDFVSENPKIKWPKIARSKIRLFNKLIDNSNLLKEKPICHLYYVTLGVKTEDDNIEAKTEEMKSNIENENLFSNTIISLVDAREIQSIYKKIGQAVTKAFEFPNRVTLPVITGVAESYLGIIEAETIIKLMTDDNGDLIPNVFYDNVRDFQGDNKVNLEIQNTLKTKDKEAFVVLNNGITIVAESMLTTRDRFTISSYQIINGCQTSHVLFENRSLVSPKVKLPLKLISTNNKDLTSKVIRSTNRQTEIKEQDLIAFSDFQKSLEDYYTTFPEKQRLYYERRSKQYNSKGVEKKRIIDKTTQIKTMASFYFDKPDMATRYFGTLFSEFGPDLFKDNHYMLPYYTSAYALYNIDKLFRRGQLDRKFKKLRYFILMMLRYEIMKEKCPPFESKKAEEYCQNCLKIINSNKKFNKAIVSIIKIIDSLKLDLSDNELSKSNKLVKQCSEKYKI